MADTLEVVILLVIAAIALGIAARRLRVPYPIALTLGGVALGFVPGLPPVRLDPDIVFVVFLPPILYRTALYMPWHSFSDNLRAIGRLAVGLVIFTTAAVAIVVKLLVPDMPWAAAFLLGAIVSPPDAVAATAILHRLNLPRRLATVIEGESLLNDGTAIILYKFALAALITGTFSVGQAFLQFLLVAGGGVAVGLAVGWSSLWVQRQLHDSLLETLLLMTAPFATFWLADEISVSGVFAVVVLGLWRAWVSPTVISAATRQRGLAMWDAVVFLLNSLIFILIGLQLPPIIHALTAFSWGELIASAAAITVAAMLARAVWMFGAAGLARSIGVLTRSTAPTQSWRASALIAFVGLRGIVSLAAAMALPLRLPDGSPLPERPLILFLTFALIVATLVGQGLSLPFVLKWLGFRIQVGDLGKDEELARVKMAYAAVGEIDRLAENMALPKRVTESVRSEFAEPLAELEKKGDSGTPVNSASVNEKRRTLRQAAIQAARRRLIKLHRDRDINDETAQTLMRELDFDELRVSQSDQLE